MKTKKKHTDYEYYLQCMVADYLDSLPNFPLWGSSLGGVRLPIGLAVKAKRKGFKKGEFDLFIYKSKGICLIGNIMNIQYNGLAIELKTLKGDIYTHNGINYQCPTTGKPSPEQLERQKRLRENGYMAEICFGWKEAKKCIDDYLR
jgi:hypothetical protein